MTAPSWVDPNLFAVCALPLGGLLLALPGLLISGKRQTRLVSTTSLTTVLALTFLVFSMVAHLCQQPVGIWLPGLVLAGTHFVLLVLNCSRTRTGLTWLMERLGHPQVSGALLLVAGMLATVMWLQFVVEPPSGLVFDEEEVRWEIPTELEDLPGNPARTDKGQPVSLKVPKNLATRDEQKWLQRQTQLLQRDGMMERVIRVEQGSPLANCHGWVFTGGRCWLPCEEVEAILQDNGYQPVTPPKPGDLAIYRDRNGVVVHSGIVWAVRNQDLVLVESKWGKMGIFLHPSHVHVYDNASCTYYRTERGSHLLAGFESVENPTTVAHRYTPLFTPPGEAE